MAQTMGPRISGRGDHLEAAIAAPDDQTDPITLPAMQIQAAAIKRDQDRHVDESADEGERASSEHPTQDPSTTE